MADDPVAAERGVLTAVGAGVGPGRLPAEVIRKLATQW